jgi:hypothetical protein
VQIAPHPGVIGFSFRGLKLRYRDRGQNADDHDNDEKLNVCEAAPLDSHKTTWESGTLVGAMGHDDPPADIWRLSKAKAVPACGRLW